MDDRREFEKLAIKDGAEERGKLLEEIRRQCGMPTDERKSRTVSRGKLAAVISACAVAVCLAIILPCVLLLKPDKSGVPTDKYCVDADIHSTDSPYSLKEYNELYGTEFLYLDWYDGNAEYTTNIRVLASTGEKVALYEDYLNIGTRDRVQILVAKPSLHTESLDDFTYICSLPYKVGDTTVGWANGIYDLYAVFTYGEYMYYVTLKDSVDQARFFEILDELIENK